MNKLKLICKGIEILANVVILTTSALALKDKIVECKASSKGGNSTSSLATENA